MKKKIIIVDDEASALRTMNNAVLEAIPDAEVQAFSHPNEALAYAEKNKIYVAFLDIEMRLMSGLSLAKNLMNLYEKTNIIFVTGYSQYALEAFSLYASGYLLKPVTAESIIESMSNLRYPYPSENNSALRVQAFGNFEVFINDVPMPFRYSKTKELFAYLIDRKGASATVGELCATLWEDKPISLSLKSHLRNIISDLSSQLRKINEQEILIKRRGSYAVAADRVNCDYYKFLTNDPSTLKSYMGEYMAQYSWAELTTGFLEKNK